MSDEFLSMTELGKFYGVSSHKMGKWLVDLGFRTKYMKPSKAAFEGGLVNQVLSSQPGTFYYQWHAEKTMQALDKAGYKRN